MPLKEGRVHHIPPAAVPLARRTLRPIYQTEAACFPVVEPSRAPPICLWRTRPRETVDSAAPNTESPLELTPNDFAASLEAAIAAHDHVTTVRSQAEVAVGRGNSEQVVAAAMATCSRARSRAGLIREHERECRAE